MVRWFFLSVLLCVLLGVIGKPGLSQALEVEMPTCEIIAFEMSKGMPLHQAILKIVSTNRNQEKSLFEATMRTLVRDAIDICNYNGKRVIQAAYQGGVPISILFEAANEAGEDRETINQAIIEAGAMRSEVRDAEVNFNTPSEPPISIFQNRSPPIGSGLDSLFRERINR